MPRRRRKRRPPAIPAEALFWGLALLNITAGCLFSPITALTKLNLSGVHPNAQAQVTKDMERLEGIPYALLHRGWVENRLMAEGNAQGIKWKGNIFGRASIELVEREAVAKISGKDLPEDLVIDGEGRFFRSVEPHMDLPLLLPPSRLTEATGMILSSWEAATAGRFLAELQGLPGLEVSVSEDSSFSVKWGDEWLQLGALASVEEAVEIVKGTQSDGSSVNSPDGSTNKQDQSDSGGPETVQTKGDSSNASKERSRTNPSGQSQESG